MTGMRIKQEWEQTEMGGVLEYLENEVKRESLESRLSIIPSEQRIV